MVQSNLLPNLPASFFIQTGERRYEPTEATIGPWSENDQHGGPPSSLLTNALRLFPSEENLKIAKIAIEFFGAVPVAPCEIKIEKIRGGKKVELLRGQYISQSKTILLSHAWRIKTHNGTLEPVSDDFEVPEFPGSQTQIFLPGADLCPYAEALEWRFAKGGYDRIGPATVWIRPRIPLIEGHDIDGLEALILMIDSANGISAELDFQKWIFVPVDMTVGLYRHPVGPWVGMSAQTQLGDEGIGLTSSIAFDSKGSLGRSMHTLFIRPR